MHNASPADAWRDTKFYWPFIVVLAFALCGFRRIAGLFALFGGFIAATYLAAAVMLTAGSSTVVLYFLAFLGVAIAGFVELRDEKTRIHISNRRLVVATGTALGVWCMVGGIIWRTYIASYPAVLAARAKTPPSRSAATDWAATTDNLRGLTTVAYCLERARGVPGTRLYPHTVTEWRAVGGPGAEPPCRSLFSSPDWLPGDTLVAELSPHTRVRYVPPAHPPGNPWISAGYTLELEVLWADANAPLPVAAAGAQNYLLDTSGTVHQAYGRRATMRDSALPVCDGSGRSRYCIAFLPRQRWGLTPDLPEVVLASSQRSTTRDDTMAFAVRYTAVAPMDSLRAIDIDWSSPNDRLHVAVPRAKSYAGARHTLLFSIRHAFGDTGVFGVHTMAITSSGGRYEHIDTVVVRQHVRSVSSLATDSAGIIVPGNATAQTTRAVANARAAMAREGGTLDYRSFCTLFVRDARVEKLVNDAYAKAFLNDTDRPAWTSVVVEALPTGALVRVDCREW